MEVSLQKCDLLRSSLVNCYHVCVGLWRRMLVNLRIVLLINRAAWCMHALTNMLHTTWPVQYYNITHAYANAVSITIPIYECINPSTLLTNYAERSKGNWPRYDTLITLRLVEVLIIYANSKAYVFMPSFITFIHNCIWLLYFVSL